MIHRKCTICLEVIAGKRSACWAKYPLSTLFTGTGYTSAQWRWLKCWLEHCEESLTNADLFVSAKIRCILCASGESPCKLLTDSSHGDVKYVSAWYTLIEHHIHIPKSAISSQCSIKNSPHSQCMQWHPVIQAGFCLKIKVFNYTRCFDKMALTSCSVSLYERERNGSTQKDVVANSGASKWMCNQQSTFVPIGYECFLLF